MKTIHSFTVKNGEKDEKFDIISPSRAVAKEAEMVYAKTYGQCVRNGLLTNAEAVKISTERGGTLTEEEKAEYAQLLNEFFSKEQAIHASKDKKEDVASTDSTVETGTEVATPEDSKKRKKRKETTQEIELRGLRERIIGFQARQDAVLANTAESKARDEAIFFNTLYLTYKDGKQFFEGKNFEEKTAKLDAGVQTDEFLQKVFRKSVWYQAALQFGVQSLSDLEYIE